METTLQEPVCCPVFNPAIWDGKTVVFSEKLFVKKATPQLFHMPLPGTIGKMMTKSWAAIEAAQAKPADADFLWLAYDPSPWKCEHYIHVTHEVPGLENVKLSGTFMAKVFDGPFNHVPKWIKEMDAYLANQGKHAKKYYFYYTTCPKCAKKYGHNYVVVFAEI
jgi:hypothetical protein